MRIVHLTPGTGNFYCGSCMRDNALVKALRAAGHDALMVPLYLPLMTDEAGTADGMPIFFGGINVYLQQKSALFRKTPAWVDHLLDAAPLLDLAARRAGMTDAHELGEIMLSMLRGEEGNQAKELHKLIGWLRAQPRPDVVCLSNAMLAGMARAIRNELRVPVICTLQGEDSFLDDLPEPYRQQAWRLLREQCLSIDAFVAVSRYHGELMKTRLGIPDDKLHVAYNGIDLDGYGPPAMEPGVPAIGYVARLCPQKGLGTLVDAFIRLRENGRAGSVQLRIAGTMTSADARFVESLKERLAEHRLERSAEFLVNIDHAAKQDFLRTLSVLSVPATYGESFGLYLLEAWASGVPVAQPRSGAFPELCALTGGGILCKPDDPRALADAIEELLMNPERGRMMGDQARRVVLERFSVERMAEEVLAVYGQALN